MPMPPTTLSVGAKVSNIPNGWRKSSQYDFPVDPRTTFKSSMLPGADSRGATLYVPLPVTVCTLVLGRAPICSLCHAFICRTPPPRTSKGSPSSETEHVEEIATRVPAEVQLSELA